MDARLGVRTILCMIGHARSWEREGAQLMVVIMTLSGEQPVEVRLAGSSDSSSANGVNGLLFHVTR